MADLKQNEVDEDKAALLTFRFVTQSSGQPNLKVLYIIMLVSDWLSTVEDVVYYKNYLRFAVVYRFYTCME